MIAEPYLFITLLKTLSAKCWGFCGIISILKKKFFFQAFANLIETGRLQRMDTDVQPYIVDGKTILSELNHSLQRHYYYAPSYGDDVPSWQPRGKNPRGSDVIAYNPSGRQLMV